MVNLIVLGQTLLVPFHVAEMSRKAQKNAPTDKKIGDFYWFDLILALSRFLLSLSALSLSALSLSLALALSRTDMLLSRSTNR